MKEKIMNQNQTKDSKKNPHYLRLKDDHPTMIKLMKLYDLAEELGLHLSFHNQVTIIKDNDLPSNHPPLRLEDVENDDKLSRFYSCQEWPPSTEFKVIYENPAYLAARKREDEEYQNNKLAEEKKKIAKAKLEQEARERAIEAKEREELARLKQKYGV